MFDTGNGRKTDPADAHSVAVVALRNAGTETKNRALTEAAKLIRGGTPEILKANVRDIDAAKQAGMSEQTFNACLSDQKMLDAMQAEQKRATEKFGVNSTPTLFVNGKKHVGGVSIEDMAKTIDSFLPKT